MKAFGPYIFHSFDSLHVHIYGFISHGFFSSSSSKRLHPNVIQNIMFVLPFQYDISIACISMAL